MSFDWEVSYLGNRIRTEDWSLIFVWPSHWQLFFVGELEGSLTSRTPQPLLGVKVWFHDFQPLAGQVLTPQVIIFSFIPPSSTYERRLLLIIFWKAAFVWVTPYLVQLTFSLEACSWKNGDLVFQRWSFFSILETCMGIDDPYVKKPRWRRNWNAISKMIKDGLAEGMVTRKLCVEVLDLVLTSFQTSFFFQGIMNRNVPTRLESTWLD